ncbi:MAG: (2Fe-2S) ferredoxin domain-containing protein [Leptospiraceae bacterium]|nr:(2Fe-2S) ferredoxin domain-containing protein [Leptospiraceae bacterium]
MGFYEKHIFVCENSREPGKRISCGWSNTSKIREYLNLKIKELAPDKKIRVNKSGCMDRCEEGPVQVAYPDGVWVNLKSEKDVDDFVNSYILKNDLGAIDHLLVK